MRGESTATTKSDPFVTRRQQVIWGAVMMSVWLATGASSFASETHTDIDLWVVLACLGGFYVWTLLEVVFPNAPWFESLLNHLPTTFLFPVGIAAAVAIGAMWLLILLLPLFGNWRRSLPLLFLIQNLYAAVQALFPLLWDV